MHDAAPGDGVYVCACACARACVCVCVRVICSRTCLEVARAADDERILHIYSDIPSVLMYINVHHARFVDVVLRLLSSVYE